ncbi:hypothetical protein [Oceanobacter kriegii]|uniref:hypothetical protein n=1 Tax=Oceanobacter kriegii TaxID=64972 RepID=UPI0012EC59B9|nr:hypothetical protein [Oceanobacter kriegii]
MTITPTPGAPRSKSILPALSERAQQAMSSNFQLGYNEQIRRVIMQRRSKDSRQPVNKDAVRRSVASSTAIETGESSFKIESRLKSGKRRFPDLTLAS